MATRILAVIWRLAIALFSDPLATFGLVVLVILMAAALAVAWHLLMQADAAVRRRRPQAPRPTPPDSHDFNPDRQSALHDLLLCQQLFQDLNEPAPPRTRILRRRKRASSTNTPI